MSGVKSRIKNATNNIKTVKFLLKESVKCIIGTMAYIFIVTYLEKSLRLDHYTLIGNNDMPTCPIVLHVVFFLRDFSRTYINILNIHIFLLQNNLFD